MTSGHSSCLVRHPSLLQESRYRLRQYSFEELARTDPVTTAQYPQTDVFDAVDHSSADRMREFQQLPPASQTCNIKNEFLI